MNKLLRYALLALAVVGFSGVVAAQKKSEGPIQCRESRDYGRLYGHYEIKEQT